MEAIDSPYLTYDQKQELIKKQEQESQQQSTGEGSEEGSLIETETSATPEAEISEEPIEENAITKVPDEQQEQEEQKPEENKTRNTIGGSLLFCSLQLLQQLHILFTDDNSKRFEAEIFRPHFFLLFFLFLFYFFSILKKSKVCTAYVVYFKQIYKNQEDIMDLKAFNTPQEIIEGKYPVKNFWIIAVDIGFSSVKGLAPNKRFCFPSYVKKMTAA